MNKYRDYIKDLLGEHFENIVNEVDYNSEGKNTLVIRHLLGVNFSGSKVQPVQLVAYVDDINTYMAILNDFAATHSKTSFMLGLDYYIHEFGTAFVGNMWGNVGENFNHQIFLTGTVIISDNISDIKTVEIDGVVVNHTEAILNYVAVGQPDKLYDEYFSKTTVESGFCRLNIMGVNKNTPFGNKLRNLRQKKMHPKSEFFIKIIFTDDTEEEYLMTVDSSATQSSVGNIPTFTVELTE